MSKEKNINNGLLITALVAIVAITGMTLFFSFQGNTLNNAANVDSAILDEIASGNLAGDAAKLGTCPGSRDCIHRNCDNYNAYWGWNTRACVNSYAVGDCSADKQCSGGTKQPFQQSP